MTLGNILYFLVARPDTAWIPLSTTILLAQPDPLFFEMGKQQGQDPEIPEQIHAAPPGARHAQLPGTR